MLRAAVAIALSLSVQVASLAVGTLESRMQLSTNDSAVTEAAGKGKSFAQMMCADFEGPKKVAVCLHGSARGFPHSLVHQSMKENLFGGSFGADMTPFLHVTRIDARGDPKGDDDVYPEWSESQITAAAKVLNIDNEDIKIFNGPDMPLPKCSEYQKDFEKREKYEASGGIDHKSTLMYANSLAGALSHRKGCMDMIAAKEKKTGSKFDLVIMSRADITYYLPMRPYCLYNLEEGKRFWDWIFMVPRDKADEMFVDTYKDFYECKKAFKTGDTVEDYIHMFDLKVDMSLPVLVTRKPGAGHSLCGLSFRLENSDFSKDDLATLCHDSFIDENKYNSYLLK